ncbi:YicC/YloC family endoribonuclease [Desulfuromonas sp. CSMB_57]|jgi:uncharacterized protein (TIGR00255 family)|uniref:YicC/YloC family endoribonuclease n=1 Tax=Desulfuromonas sp. CSMB_57 TaxID=2807629 RepID=UPI001CD635A8|nr:YicC/YloC family endoribonuclease [Desulfuromonas sp. CSMB_57]
MIKSMTGYGKGQARVDDVTLTIEIKSVNHRYGDIGVKTPRCLLAQETEIRRRIGERLKRGKIDLYINLELASGSARMPVLNRELAAAYLEQFRALQSQFGLEGGVTPALLAGQKDVLTLSEGEPDEAALLASLDAALDQALDAMERMRMAEGAATQRDLEERFIALDALLEGARQRAPLIPAEWQGRLQERLSRLQNGFEFDVQRVAQEIAIFADRCDISEELTRFQSHLEQFRGLFEAEEPIGRQMDFLVQEMNREANTMGSKSNDLELTRTVVAIKAELEKVREQVQNIE